MVCIIVQFPRISETGFAQKLPEHIATVTDTVKRSI